MFSSFRVESMGVFKHRLNYLTLILLFSFQSQNLLSQENGAELFDDNCADCHTIGDGDMSGPDLLGVENKHSNEWLHKFIQSSKSMIASGDAEAVAIYEEFEEENMPNTNLPKASVQLIIDYIKSFNTNVVEVELHDQTSNSSDLSQGSTNDPGNGNLNSSQGNIEKKLDVLLSYHKKLLSARFTEEEVLKGEALFTGRTSFKNDIPPCVSCHNIEEIDTLNWNPSAIDIISRFSDQDNSEMVDLMVNPTSKIMQDLLKDNPLRDDESFYITAYMKDLEKKGLKSINKFPVERSIFIGICIIMFLFLFDLLITKQIKYKSIPLTIIIASFVYIIHTLYQEANLVGLSQNYAPDQPIKFSHKIHVDDNEIKCIFCHNSPEYSRESGIPTTNVCMICHNKIKSGDNSGSFEINKIRKSFEEKEPIVWNKIHNLPDHVFFSHAIHVDVAKVKCSECHGQVEKMDVTYQYSSLSMGWCVECHRKTEVQFNENEYYSGHTSLIDDLFSGKMHKVTADMIGANDCQKCHY